MSCITQSLSSQLSHIMFSQKKWTFFINIYVYMYACIYRYSCVAASLCVQQTRGSPTGWHQLPPPTCGFLFVLCHGCTDVDILLMRSETILFSVLQIALFYVAVLAGLLHRFPVSFSQVWTIMLLISVSERKCYGHCLNVSCKYTAYTRAA